MGVFKELRSGDTTKEFSDWRNAPVLLCGMVIVRANNIPTVHRAHFGNRIERLEALPSLAPARRGKGGSAESEE